MYLILTGLLLGAMLLGAVLLVAVLRTRARNQRQLEQHSITAEALHTALAQNPSLQVYDVRVPLDLLAESEIIPGARRIPPKDIVENPALIPADEDTVVYCTCPNAKTSKAVLRRALAAHLTRVKFLEGGLAAWKAKGYPVDRYEQSFHLDTA